MKDPRIHFVNGKLRSALWARAQLSSAVSGEHKLLQNTQHQKNPWLRPENDPFRFPEAPKTRTQLNCRHFRGQDVRLPYLVLRKIAPDSFISPGGATSAVDPLEVSAQIRRNRRPNSGLCTVLECRERDDPFVRVAYVRFDRTIKVFCELAAALFWSQEAAQPARHESDKTKRKNWLTVRPGPAPSRCCPISFLYYLFCPRLYSLPVLVCSYICPQIIGK